MGHPGKAWDILEKHGKYWKSMGNTGKAWEIPKRHGKSQDSLSNPWKAWEIPGKHVKYREILGKLRKSQEKCEILENAFKNQEMLLKPVFEYF